MTSQPHGLTLDLRPFLEDPSLDDVTLIGRDDKSSVTAIRAILAARSPVFRTLLYNQHRDAALHVGCCDVDILKLIIEYCYTDALESICVRNDEEGEDDDDGDCDLDEHDDESDDEDDSLHMVSLRDMSEESVRRAVRLHECAIHFELPELTALVEYLVTDAMCEHLSLASVVLDEIENTTGISHFVDAAAASSALAEQRRTMSGDEENQVSECRLEEDGEDKQNESKGITSGSRKGGGMLCVAVAIARARPRLCLTCAQGCHPGTASEDEDAKEHVEQSGDGKSKSRAGSGVLSFTTGAPLEFLINDEKRTVNDTFLLECLIRWVKGAEGQIVATSPRFIEAQRIIADNCDTLRLSKVNQTFLLAVVKPSGLVNVTQVNRALERASTNFSNTRTNGAEGRKDSESERELSDLLRNASPSIRKHKTAKRDDDPGPNEEGTTQRHVDYYGHGYEHAHETHGYEGYSYGVHSYDAHDDQGHSNHYYNYDGHGYHGHGYELGHELHTHEQSYHQPQTYASHSHETYHHESSSREVQRHDQNAHALHGYEQHGSGYYDETPEQSKPLPRNGVERRTFRMVKKTMWGLIDEAV